MRIAPALAVPFFLITCLLPRGMASGQEPTTAGAVFVYAPHAGERSAFEDGYRRHLAWHEENRDPLPWFGWDVLVGRRPGLFVDGVFGVPFVALDARVDPAGDQADAAANVLPHADAVGREVIALRPDLSTATPLSDGAPTPLVQVVRYAVAPERSLAMEHALRGLKGQADGGELLPYTVYERVAGAPPGFVVMIWRDRLATFDDHDRNPERVLNRLLAREWGAVGRAGEDGRAADILDAPVISELWVYRRDLTYLGARDGGR